MTDVKSLNQVVDAKADLIYLDITGIASSLDSDEEGLSVLEYVKKHQPSAVPGEGGFGRWPDVERFCFDSKVVDHALLQPFRPRAGGNCG